MENSHELGALKVAEIAYGKFESNIWLPPGWTQASTRDFRQEHNFAKTG